MNNAFPAALKWFESPDVDKSVVISSRIRLARNFTAYLFPSRIDEQEASEVIRRIKKAVEDSIEIADLELDFVDLSNIGTNYMQELLERHIISREMVNKTISKGLIFNKSENISILINEEDHLRIQAIAPSGDLDNLFNITNKLDNILTQHIDYAFDKDFGFLTSCPTNTGTGMRASYMLHLPLLESSGNLKGYADFITKAHFTIRGTHGEGSESMGSIYQLSNQFTLGKSENETIASLKHLANQLIEKENELRERVYGDFRIETEDNIFRAYGILANCRKISLTEAMRLLSDIRLGRMLGMLGIDSNDLPIYTVMTGILPYNLQNNMKSNTRDSRQIDILRADYLREVFKL